MSCARDGIQINPARQNLKGSSGDMFIENRSSNESQVIRRCARSSVWQTDEPIVPRRWGRLGDAVVACKSFWSGDDDTKVAASELMMPAVVLEI
mmetsp:Transcript_37781/g.79982  ORF Transcript_37781/g.79982 Transcript_37781/m.79982 type:complete len:94 (+) Transcript_37781:10-291(+)